MAPSFHWQNLFIGDEDVEDFSEAWKLQNARATGQSMPKGCRDLKLVQYGIGCKLGAQLKRLYCTVERERVLVLFLEDIQQDVYREWSRVLRFLGVPYWDELEFRTENRSKHWHWRWVRDLKRFYYNTRHRFSLPPLGWGVFGRLQKMSVKEAQREPLSASMRRELIETFSEDIDQLAQLTGRDLSHWKYTS